MGRVTDQQSSIHTCNRYTKGRKGGELARLQILLKSRTPLPTKGNSKRTMSEKRKKTVESMWRLRRACVYVCDLKRVIKLKSDSKGKGGPIPGQVKDRLHGHAVLMRDKGVRVGKMIRVEPL
jgi:hypothetical protein